MVMNIGTNITINNTDEADMVKLDSNNSTVYDYLNNIYGELPDQDVSLYHLLKALEQGWKEQ